ncbi:hypothetical protein R1sor_006530 [Riccia sorocarpa]|uniref:Transmembrane protein n=1 Tax=Riccia sorocarpa TaxID=122646 RepID=A0ABD3HRB3_9MARC
MAPFASLIAPASVPVFCNAIRPKSWLSPDTGVCVCILARKSIKRDHLRLSFRRFWPALIGIRSRNAVRGRGQKSERVLCSSVDGQSATGDPSSSSDNTGGRSPFLKWVLVAVGVAAAGVAVYMKIRNGDFTNSVSEQGPVLQVSPDAASSFSIKLPGFSLSLGERTPGWVYFFLLMAAGFGLFVSEEAMNVWVGASLARCLSYSSREAFFSSLSANASYIISTVIWVYWGVCISDMVPFYAGKLASKSGNQVREKLGVSKEKYEKVTATVQRYGNLIGFVERFSVGVRNPTAFLAGVAMSIGFLLRENPVAALAGVAAVVGAWTVFPYGAAAVASVYFFLRRHFKSP